ncbi:MULTISPECIES: CII family transcriptional regulator [Proteus]|uniref:CII family transcriptional regulator n=1 Tax=Proteus TaxID=583 RepID=UPI001377C709|nr:MULTISPECIES: CII family transcriptional regulator [Proteus]MBI6367389.1 transcriptional regulator [Proteus mirabilis]MDM3618140.1 CII family transcriptional regulator [Proteus mirabilis]MDM3665380.1 CII family transcriptional regulator [Proteus mirabilis]NBN02434.1 transcriptional regulator [Proteus sp. G4465]NBN09214.1 transcriptional regulator [Proteus sp. G4463]
MELSNERKFREIESKIMKGILVTGAREVAKRTGIHESQISRWQSPQSKTQLSFIQRCARLLVAIGYETPDDTVILQGDEARALIQMLDHVKAPKRKTSTTANGEASQQMDLTI